MSTKLRSWHVSRVDRSLVNAGESPDDVSLVHQPRKTRVGKVQAVTRDEATALAAAAHPGIEIEITRDE